MIHVRSRLCCNSYTQKPIQYTSDSFSTDKIPGETTSSSDLEEVSSWLRQITFFHLKVYALADMTQNDCLMTNALKKFALIVEWDDPSFHEVVKLVYEVAPPGARGDGLRAVVVKTTARHCEDLFSENDHFTTMMSSVADFGKDLSLALSGIYKFSADPALHSLFSMTTRECPSCTLSWSDTRVLNEKPLCPRCSDDSALGLVATRQLHTYTCSRHECDYYL